jgi:hypothetical protein
MMRDGAPRVMMKFQVQEIRRETHDPPCTRFEPDTSQNSSEVATAISKADTLSDQHNALSQDRKTLQLALL